MSSILLMKFLFITIRASPDPADVPVAVKSGIVVAALVTVRSVTPVTVVIAVLDTVVISLT